MPIDCRLANGMLLASLAAVAVAIAAMHISGAGDCSARVLFGKECVLCGMTRDFFAIFSGGGPFRNPASPFVFAAIPFELVWRMYFAIRPYPRRAVAAADAAVHAAVAAAFLVWNFIALA